VLSVLYLLVATRWSLMIRVHVKHVCIQPLRCLPQTPNNASRRGVTPSVTSTSCMYMCTGVQREGCTAEGGLQCTTNPPRSVERTNICSIRMRAISTMSMRAKETECRKRRGTRASPRFIPTVQPPRSSPGVELSSNLPLRSPTLQL